MVGDLFARKKKKKKRPVHVVAVKSFLSSLVGTGLTQAGILSATGLCKITIRRYVNTLHTGQHTFIHITRYVRQKNLGAWSPVYCYGLDLPSLKSPPPKSRLNRRHSVPNWVKVKSPKGTYYEYRNSDDPELGTTIERSY